MRDVLVRPLAGLQFQRHQRLDEAAVRILSAVVCAGSARVSAIASGRRYPSLDLDVRTHHEEQPAGADKYVLTTHWVNKPQGCVRGTDETAALYPEVFAGDASGTLEDAARLEWKGGTAL